MKDVISSLKHNNDENVNIYIVGEYIRDFLLGKKRNEIDIIVEKDLDIIVKKLKFDNDDKNMNINFDNYSYYTIVDRNNEITINFYVMNKNNIEEELKCRDFTINSLAVNISEINTLDDINENNIIDPLGGIDCIKKELIKVTDEDIFNKNPEKIIKAVRLMAELNFDMDEKTIDLIRNNPELVKNISALYLRDELFRLLKLSKTHNYFVFMDNIGILEYIFPEINPMKEIGKCKYHVVNTFTHSLYTLKIIEEIIYANGYFEEHLRKEYEKLAEEEICDGRSRLALIKLGAFFHDVGKPSARKVDDTGRVRFRGHEVTGAEIITDIARRLNLSRKEEEILYKIVKKHMLPLVSYKANDVSGKYLYKMFKEFNGVTLDILLIALADIIATRKLLYPDEDMNKFKVHIEYIANNYITRYRELENIDDTISIKDIENILETYDSEKIYNMLDEIKEEIYTAEIPKKKKAIIKYIKEKNL